MKFVLAFIRIIISVTALLQVASFQCLQPFVGTLLAFLVLGEEPSIWDLGAVGVVAGLVLVAFDRKDESAPFSNLVVSRMKKIMSHSSLAGLPMYSHSKENK